MKLIESEPQISRRHFLKVGLGVSVSVVFAGKLDCGCTVLEDPPKPTVGIRVDESFPWDKKDLETVLEMSNKAYSDVSKLLGKKSITIAKISKPFLYGAPGYIYFGETLNFEWLFNNPEVFRGFLIHEIAHAYAFMWDDDSSEAFAFAVESVIDNLPGLEVSKGMTDRDIKFAKLTTLFLVTEKNHPGFLRYISSKYNQEIEKGDIPIEKARLWLNSFKDGLGEKFLNI